MKAFLDSLRHSDIEWRLAQQIQPERLPAHIAVIMDGNGRWANQRNLPRIAGHRAGMEPVRTVVKVCGQIGIEVLTLYAFSVENWKRPRHEVETLWKLLRLYLRKELPELMDRGVRVSAIGRIGALPPLVRRDLDYVEAQTAGNQGLRLNLAINYGGRAEIVDAVNALLRQTRLTGQLEIDEQALSAHLYTSLLPDPDLLIRTSGEMRVSNFLLWQIAYAELYVTDTLWPDFGRVDLLRAIIEFQKRNRRFGGVTAERYAAGEPLVAAAGAPAR